MLLLHEEEPAPAAWLTLASYFLPVLNSKPKRVWLGFMSFVVFLYLYIDVKQKDEADDLVIKKSY